MVAEEGEKPEKTQGSPEKPQKMFEQKADQFQSSGKGCEFWQGRTPAE